jgi:hypothetical protein
MSRKRAGGEAERLRVLIVETSTLDEDDGVLRALENLPSVEASPTVADETIGGGHEPHAVLLDLRLRPGAGTISIVVEGLSGHRMIVPLAEAVPKDRYRLELDDGGRAEISFGDGAAGARPSTSSRATRASYRVGTGRAGNVGGSTITLLEERPRGIAAVKNPVRARGGADPDARDDVRRAAPSSVSTLDRLVSAADYEDFLIDLLGVARAAARAHNPRRKRREATHRVVEVKIPADPAKDG